MKNDFPDGIIRSLSLKPRQAGWSTLIAGINTHRTCTTKSYKGIVIADKFARTQAVHSIYTTYIDNLPAQLRPMIAKRNDSEILFDNPNPSERLSKPGLGSGFLTETAQDENSGKSSSRQWAHLSEYGFYPYASALDQSVQNSIGLHKGTAIFKESTANGMGGIGASFYEQWIAAERGDYIYKPFFVAWYEVDDYAMNVPMGFRRTKEESELVKRCPNIQDQNLVWRRMKIREIYTGTESGLSPEELFVQDFCSYPEEAFLSSGRPVFDMEKLKDLSIELRNSPPPRAKITITQPVLKMFPDLLTVFKTPEPGKKYFIGADVALGLEIGDSSSAKIINQDMEEVALFHGKIDPDLFGKVLVELARIYNNALIIPEVNSMGHTTLNAIKESGYLKVYMREIKDEIEDGKETAKLGFVTTSKSKQDMLNRLIIAFREGDCRIYDTNLIKEMMNITREPNGDVNLNGKDRIVAMCLALVGASQNHAPAVVYNPHKKERLLFSGVDKSRDVILKKEK